MTSPRPVRPLALLVLSALPATWALAREVQVPIPGAQQIVLQTVLPNGNLVVVDAAYDLPGVENVGAVHLLAPDGSLISTLHGQSPGDAPGTAGIVVLPNGNYLVKSPQWDNGAIVDAGALTWCDGDTGLNDAISADNSLIGDQPNGRVSGAFTSPENLIVLSNGNFLLYSDLRDAQNALIGAITWGNGNGGSFGVISPANAMVGQANGSIGSGGIFGLSNGHAVALTPGWDSPSQQNVGAVTWINGEGAMSGTLSASNSQTGTRANDEVGSGGVTLLPNGHFVVLSPRWTAGEGAIPRAGAASWHSGSGSTAGVISPANALVGTASDDLVGASVVVLANANYLVVTPGWDQNGGLLTDAGAVSWGPGGGPASGTIGAGRSLVGSAAQDRVGSGGVLPLSGGAYVIASPQWDNGPGMGNVGAVSWGNGVGVLAAPVSMNNSLVGSSFGDQVGSEVKVLASGHYVVATPAWNGGRGAVAWGNGSSGLIGQHAVGNSLLGSTPGDRVGQVLLALPNGHYVVGSPQWRLGSATDVGAVTWGNGHSGTSGAVSPANSTVGTTASDSVGSALHALANGHYLIRSPGWQDALGYRVGAITWRDGSLSQAGTVGAGNSMLGTGASALASASIRALRSGHYLIASPNAVIGGAAAAGLVSWGNGNGGSIGTLSSANALQGRSPNDRVGAQITELENGHYLVSVPSWDSPNAIDVGAYAWGNGASGVSGFLSPLNALTGSLPGDGILSVALPFVDGNYAVAWPRLDQLPLVDSGAWTLVRGSLGAAGATGSTNSLLGLSSGQGTRVQLLYDPVGRRGVLTREAANPVIFRSFDVLLALQVMTGPTAGSLTLTASLTGSRPMGTLSFTYGAEIAIAGCEAVPLSGDGDVRTATCSTGALPTGEIPVHVRYAGDAHNDPGTLTQVVSTGSLFSNGFE